MRGVRAGFYGKPGGGGGVSDACAVCKSISAMKALQLGRGVVKSTNFIGLFSRLKFGRSHTRKLLVVYV